MATAEAEFGPVGSVLLQRGHRDRTGPGRARRGGQQIWSVNVMAHVHAVNAVVPGMIERGGGYLLHTVSAAGLLTCPGDAPYTATKHAAIGVRRVAVA